jgi:methylglutaconyl-CoA hydratase
MLRADQRGPVLELTLDRPDVRNAINDELIAALTTAIADIKTGTRAIVIQGEGASFCAGGDLNWMRKAASYTVEENYLDALKLAHLFEAMTACPAVIIVLCQGAAFGGGSGLVAAADVAVAVEGTKFCFSEVKLGLIPATISAVVLPKIGVGHARHLFTTAEVFDARRAYEIGLVHHVRDSIHSARTKVDELLSGILMNGPHAVAESKRIAVDYPLALEETARRLAEIRAGDEGKEGVAAFLDKRPASFAAKLDS